MKQASTLTSTSSLASPSTSENWDNIFSIKEAYKPPYMYYERWENIWETLKHFHYNGFTPQTTLGCKPVSSYVNLCVSLFIYIYCIILCSLPWWMHVRTPNNCSRPSLRAPNDIDWGQLATVSQRWFFLPYRNVGNNTFLSSVSNGGWV